MAAHRVDGRGTPDARCDCRLDAPQHEQRFLDFARCEPCVRNDHPLVYRPHAVPFSAGPLNPPTRAVPRRPPSAPGSARGIFSGGTLYDATEPRTPALAPRVKGEEMLGTCKALGAIDTTTAPSFNADLHDAIDDADEAFVHVDCSAVTYIDSAGYRVLVDATNYASRRGHTLVIRNLSPSCATLIRMFDVDRELHVEP